MDERCEGGFSSVWFAGNVPDDGAMLVKCDVVVEEHILEPLTDAVGPLVALDLALEFVVDLDLDLVDVMAREKCLSWGTCEID